MSVDYFFILYLLCGLQPMFLHTVLHWGIAIFLVHAFLHSEIDQSRLLQIDQKHDNHGLQSLHWQRHPHKNHHHQVTTCHVLFQEYVPTFNKLYIPSEEYIVLRSSIHLQCSV